MMPHLPGHNHNKNHEPRSSSGGSGQLSREQLALAFEDEKERIVRSCFSKVDEQNHLLEKYITHVRVTEDSYYPSSKPPPTSPDKNKKQRAVIIAVRKSGRVRVHKARENPNGTFQIGKTWNLDDLTKIEGDTADMGAFIMHMGKPYYWVTRSSREKSMFVNSAVIVYKRYTGKMPEMVNIEANGGQSSQNPRFISSEDAPPFHQPQSPGGIVGGTQSSYGQSPQVSHPSPLVQTPPIGSSYSFPGPQQQTPPLRPGQTSAPTPAGPASTPSNRIATEKRNVTPSGPRAPPAEMSTASKPIPINMAPPPMPSAMGMAQSPSSTHSVSTSHSLPNSERHKRSPSATSKTSNQSFPANLRPTGYVTTQPLKPADDSWQQPQSNRQSFHQQRRSVHLDNTNSLELAPTRQRALSNHALLHVSQKSVISPPAPPVPNANEIDTDVARFSTNSGAFASKSSPNILESFDADAPEATSNHGPSHNRSRSVLSDVKVFAHTNRSSQVIIADEQEQFEQDNVTVVDFNKQVPKRDDEDKELKEMINTSVMKNQTDTLSTQGSFQRPEIAQETRVRGREHRRDISFSAQSNASAVEETLGEFNWTGRDDVKSLEMTIGNELLELETANTHNVVDLDDRLDEIDHILESAIAESERLDTVLAFFSVQLSAFSEDVKHIESQGKGIQVQTNHQKDLWNELSRILQTVNIPDDVLRTLLACRINNTKELASTEAALVKLYHGLEISEASQGDSLSQMRAIQEKRSLYEQARNEFGSRFKQHIEIKFKEASAESKGLYSNTEEPVIIKIEGVFMRHLYPFCGILLYLREMDTMTYESVLKMYEYCVQPYYDDAISQYMAKWRKQVSMLLSRAEKFSFVNYAKAKAQSTSDNLVSKSLKRSGTLAKFRSNDSKESLSAALSASTSPNLSEDKVVWTPNVKQREQVKAALTKILDGIAGTFISQQELLIQLFHQSSFSEFNFPEFVKRMPVASRRDGESMLNQFSVREVESDVTRGKELFMHMNQIFSSFHDRVIAFTDFFIKNSSLETPYLLALTEKLLSRYEATNQDFLSTQLTRLRDRLVQGWLSYIQQQISAISNTVVSSKKRKGVVYFVKVLPGFCKVIESDLQAIHTPEHPISELPVRKVINDTYERIFKEVFRNLQRIAKEPSAIESTAGAGPMGASAEHEDKEQLNYHVMMIENMNVLNEGLMDSSNGVLMSYRGNAIITYKKELEIYINSVLHRPLGKVLDFVEGVETLLAKNARENPSTRSAYSRGNVKRMLAGMDAKEVRKGVSTLYARVEKHFWGETEDSHADKDPHLVSKVWNAIEAQYQSTISRLIKILDQYYSDGDGQPASVTLLEFSKQDISAAFNAKR